MTKTTTTTRISISVDGVWSGSGRVVDDSRIVDCGAVFAGGQDESDDVYEAIEEAISEGRDSQRIEHADGTTHVYTWSIATDDAVAYLPCCHCDGTGTIEAEGHEPCECSACDGTGDAQDD